MGLEIRIPWAKKFGDDINSLQEFDDGAELVEAICAFFFFPRTWRNSVPSFDLSVVRAEYWSRGVATVAQDMYTRHLSANLDFDSELQHVFCWEPDECRDSRVFHVDRVFLRLC